MNLKAMWVLILMAFLASFAVIGAVSCDDDDDDDDDNDDGDQVDDDDEADDDDLADDDVAGDDDDLDEDDWYKGDLNAYENCMAFFAYYYDCFGLDPDPTQYEDNCTHLEGWEDLYDEDYCMLAALTEFWLCLKGLDCEDFGSFQEMDQARLECSGDYGDAVAACPEPDDDDDDNDDDFVPDPDAPQVSFAEWFPATAEYSAIDDHWISYIYFFVCDPNNDLLWNGQIFVYQTGTTNLIWANPLNWADFGYLPDVTDCTFPTEIQVGTIFGTGTTPPGFGLFCTDLQVTDTMGHLSNKEVNFCVTVP